VIDEVSYSRLTLLAFLERSALVFPGRTAVVDDDRRFTWELIAFSRETLPGFKAPSEIEFGELPKTSTGKVKKYELRERASRRRPS
jgi:acyl-CoA synthetase (AMP-forming)/AMP-acid ligase II